MTDSINFDTPQNISLHTSLDEVAHFYNNTKDYNLRTHSTLSYDEYEQFTFICYNFVIPGICLCGLVGNTMAVTVLYRIARQRKRSIYIYMCALTAIDTTYMFISIIRSIIIIIENVDINVHNYIYRHTLIHLIFLDVSLSAISAIMLILMSTERLIAIRRPLSVRTTVIAKRPFLFIITACVLVFLITTPLPASLVITTYSISENQLVYRTNIKSGMIEFFEIYIPVETVILNYIPYLAILVLNMAILKDYYATLKRRYCSLKVTNVSKEFNRRIVATVFIVSIMYTLLSLPQIIIQTLSVVNNRFRIGGSEENVFLLLSDITDILVNLNMSTDFVIYILMSKLYRQRFLDIFFRR